MKTTEDLANVTRPTVGQVYVAVGNSDTSEGRGASTVVVAVCLTHAGATSAGKGRYVQGSDCPVEAQQALFMPGGSVYLLERAHRLTPDSPEVRMRQAALAKLTAEDRRILGLA